MLKTVLAALLLLSSLGGVCRHSFAQINQALFTDPRPDDKFPAQMNELALPSHGEMLLGVFYLAVGEKPHPTVVLLHGFPGYEQNLDLAQALRRAGWNVLAMHYRGSWGVHGTFSFTHCIEDADAMVNFVLDPANATKYRIDTKKIAVIGHSMGGFMATQAMARHPEIEMGVLLSAGNPAEQSHFFDAGVLKEDLMPLNDTSVSALKAEAVAHSAEWSYSSYAAKIAPRPVLILTAEDDLQASNEALAELLKKAGDTKAQALHMRTSHSFDSRRVAVISTIVDWLARN